jgi:hypothetical protein
VYSNPTPTEVTVKGGSTVTVVPGNVPGGSNAAPTGAKPGAPGASPATDGSKPAGASPSNAIFKGLGLRTEPNIILAFSLCFGLAILGWIRLI